MIVATEKGGVSGRWYKRLIPIDRESDHRVAQVAGIRRGKWRDRALRLGGAAWRLLRYAVIKRRFPPHQAWSAKLQFMPRLASETPTDPDRSSGDVCRNARRPWQTET